MAHELRNLPHIASMAFNEPLMLEPAYARVFFCALAGQLGITRLTDTVSGITLDAGQIAEPLALFGEDDDMDPRPSRSYQVANGIAVLPVSGTLVSKTRALQPYSGMTGYNGIIARLQQAISDPGVDGILLDMDTPGGMVSGAFDCADIIARMRDIGGIDPTIVYNRSKKHGLFRVIPIKGASVYGKPVANMPRKRNKNGVYLTEVGTDTAKEQIYNRFTLVAQRDEPLAGAVHFPNNPEIYDLTEAQQLTAEEQVEKWVDGKKKIVWDSKKRRNEALDCFVYALAALRISISRWQLNLDSLLASLLEEEGTRNNNKTLADYARALSGEE